jgi:hypothetical protein
MAKSASKEHPCHAPRKRVRQEAAAFSAVVQPEMHLAQPAWLDVQVCVLLVEVLNCCFQNANTITLLLVQEEVIV